MKAVVVRRGGTRPTVAEIDEPTPEAGEALLRTLRVGIDGTDHEVVEGNHGGFPAGDDHQVLGHEAVAVVADANGTGLDEGQLVVPTVRRPREDGNEYFERGEPDMAPDGEYVERGIVGAHGYMAEYFTSTPRFLVPVPDAFAETGFLIEPISNAEKALEHAHATRSAFEWEPEIGLVLGNGPLGLLTLAMLGGERTAFSRAYCLGRRDRPDPTIDIIEGLGATYVDSRETPVDAIADAHEPMDFVCEATGYARHAFQTVHALRPNGVGALLGIPEGWSFEIDGGALHRELVLGNKALFGSVNSNVRQFEAAIDSLDSFPEWFVEDLITGVYEPDEVETAFETGDEVIKTVVEFDAL
jgi:threonine dehydrogenase-like Zn-dependent dehydrogenase